MKVELNTEMEINNRKSVYKRNLITDIKFKINSESTFDRNHSETIEMAKSKIVIDIKINIGVKFKDGFNMKNKIEIERKTC